ncbi:MAG: glycine--tRNA ligase subunit beta [Alphaproteobacteria bacterium]|nr:glycine--tRNA ligase subunit beta [Alphaproteobacteria bacterium]
MSQLLVEVQCEELPATFVRPALDALRTGVLGLLEGIEHGGTRVYATPRRLAVVVDGVAEGRPEVQKEVLGPPESSAFKDGEPTKVAIGFARGKGVDVADLRVVDGPKGRVVAALITEGGESTRERVASGLDGVVRGIGFRKSMEWGSGGTRWARPIHRVNAVYAGEAIYGEAAGVRVDNITVGHRLAEDTGFAFNDEASWLAGLRKRAVEPDLDARKARVRELVLEGIAAVGGDPVVDEALLEEVTHLVEAPTLVRGAFDAELLALPPRLLVKAMKAHQRYFPVTRDGALTEHFVVISNNPWGAHDPIAAGNANVLRARFHDAQFFFAEDQKKRLETHGLQLEKMRWIRGLGSMAAKAVRVAELGQRLAAGMGADPAKVHRAGELCKSDLATLMVGEFPDLQGHMGRLYATAQGEDPTVALAIEEHYQPAGADDALPTTAEGRTLALAERLDTLVGCFGIGMTPSGSGDPQGLRRAVIGVLALLGERRASLEPLFEAAMDVFHTHAHGKDYDRWTKAQGDDFRGRDALLAELLEFARTRFKAQATRGGVSGDLVDAVLAVGEPVPVDWSARLDALVKASRSEGFLPIMHTFKRVLNITQGSDAAMPRREALVETASKELFDRSKEVAARVDTHVAALDYDGAFAAALTLAPAVSRFFDDVLVEDKDPKLRAARKGLLLGVAAIFRRLADFSRISTR